MKQKLYKKIVMWDEYPNYVNILSGITIMLVGILGFCFTIWLMDDIIYYGNLFLFILLLINCFIVSIVNQI